MQTEMGRQLHRVDFGVSKMYWKSKKNVYGINNELEIVEQIQKILSQFLISSGIKNGQMITHEIISQVFGR
jgi:hypothetical protein